MATTAALVKEGLISGSARFKIYRVTKDGSSTTVAIIPGKGFSYCVGSELGYTVATSSGITTFTLAEANGTASDLYDVMFLSS